MVGGAQRSDFFSVTGVAIGTWVALVVDVFVSEVGSIERDDFVCFDVEIVLVLGGVSRWAVEVVSRGTRFSVLWLAILHETWKESGRFGCVVIC